MLILVFSRLKKKAGTLAVAVTPKIRYNKKVQSQPRADFCYFIYPWLTFSLTFWLILKHDMTHGTNTE